MSSDGLGQVEELVGSKSVVQMGTNQLYYTRAPGFYNKDPLWKLVSHNSVDDVGIYF